ncbi:MAG: hypothetical protein KME43_09540 [Myxacorys chilensis ATA2-1-KO14]|jgi:gas vesicle protein|nr:hypothetical protein [Myxacorys chilensis ATA2-1-KO14]
MSQQDNFSSGFFLGAIAGGVVGGVLGVLVSQRLGDKSVEEPLLKAESAQSKALKARRRSLRASSEQNIELARQSLEDKIAQLNTAIDDVRQQLGSVNGRPTELEENTIGTKRNPDGSVETS